MGQNRYPDFDSLMDDVFGASDDDLFYEDADMEDDEPLYTDDEIARELAIEGNCNEDGDDDDDDDDDEDDIDDEMDDIDDEDDIDDIDLSDISDDDLDDMARSMNDLDDLEDNTGDVEPVKLTPDEEVDADDMMQIAGSAALIRDELNANERAEFLENAQEVNTAIVEGFLTTMTLQDLRDSSNVMDVTESADDDEEEYTEAKMYNKTVVHFSKDARMRQLYAIAINSSARAHNDPDYVRYAKASRLKRFYRSKLRKKYHNEATKRMKVLFARLKSSKSPTIKSLSKNMK